MSWLQTLLRFSRPGYFDQYFYTFAPCPPVFSFSLSHQFYPFLCIYKIFLVNCKTFTIWFSWKVYLEAKVQILNEVHPHRGVVGSSTLKIWDLFLLFRPRVLGNPDLWSNFLTPTPRPIPQTYIPILVVFLSQTRTNVPTPGENSRSCREGSDKYCCG